MQAWLFVLLGAIALWALAEAKTSRPDGTPVRTHPYRRLMFFVMPTRAESVVFIDATVRAEKLMQYLKDLRGRFEADVSHVAVAAVAIALAENPRMNRFVSGRRLYQRNGRWLTFSMKRRKLDQQAALSMVKMCVKDGLSFEQLCAEVNEKIATERSGQRTATDREYALFDALPRPALELAVPLLRLLDHYNLLPRFFIEGDGLYTSVFLANLGSIRMPSAYHHLYEWGNCPFFVAIGSVEQRVVVEDGAPVVRTVLPVRITFDERVDDGLAGAAGIASFVRVLEDPARWLGGLAEDGSDAHPLGPRSAPEPQGPSAR